MTECSARASCAREVEPPEITCPVCLGRTRSNLDKIAYLATQMPVEAIYAGINSEAAYLAGPAADPTTWSARRVYVARTTGVMQASLEDDDPWHPYSVLTRWQMMIEEDYGLRDTRKMTISGAAAFFARDDGRFLHRFANDPEQDFPLFAREVAACLTHLEAVIHDSRVPELGAPCPECSDEAGFADRLVKRYVDEDPTGASDRWVCPLDPGHYWSEADYRMRVGANYLAYAAALTADQIRDQYRIAPGTLRRWAAEGKVAKRGRDGHGRQMYDVAEARGMREVIA